MNPFFFISIYADIKGIGLGLFLRQDEKTMLYEYNLIESPSLETVKSVISNWEEKEQTKRNKLKKIVTNSKFLADNLNNSQLETIDDMADELIKLSVFINDKKYETYHKIKNEIDRELVNYERDTVNPIVFMLLLAINYKPSATISDIYG